MSCAQANLVVAMAFLFKSKKDKTGGLPPATRNIHTSEGTAPGGQLSNGYRDKGQSPTPSSSVNNSLNSLAGDNRPDPQWQRRERADSEPQQGQQAKKAQPPGNVPNAALYPWSQRRLNFPTPQSNPFPRYGAATNAVASKEGDIYLMGGLVNGSLVKGDLWMVECGGGNLSCYPIATISDGPGPRVGHASLLVGNAFIVFGGDTKMDDTDTLDDTLYLLNTSSRQWSRASPPGQKPSGRYGHTLNILGSKIYIFGGQVEGYFFNDLIAFDLNQLQNPANQWDFLVPTSADAAVLVGQLPPARTNHSIVSYNDKLYLFGGTNGQQWFNDVWTYDPRLNRWAQEDCIGYIPAAREGHAAALVNDVMYIFGGRTEEGTDLGDLAAFRISSRRWYTFQNMGPSPSPRSGHSMTAYGKQIVVLAGEPSSAPRDPGELSLVYVLDTGKIRYPPNDQSAQQSSMINQTQRRPSTDQKSAIPTSIRSVSREGQTNSPDNIRRSESRARDAPPSAPSAVRASELATGSGPTSRLPRASIAQAPAGPPPPGQAPAPKQAGSITLQAPPRSKTPTKGPPVDTVRAAASTQGRDSPAMRESPKDPVSRIRDGSPASQGRRTPTGQTSKLAARAMEAGEAAPLVHSGPARQRSLRSQRGQGSIDSTHTHDESGLGRSLSGRLLSEAGDRNSRTFIDAPQSPRLTPHQEALMKELDAAKSRNAWYASELALARKAGYQASSMASPTLDVSQADQFGEEDKPLIEALLTMRSELASMQQTIEQQAGEAARRMAEVEHQRDAAISEAAYARAKLAAHGGSQRGTPQPEARDIDDDNRERSTDLSRRLALALAAQSEHKAKVDALTAELQAEKRSRELAEEAAGSAQKRLSAIGQGRNPLELESMRAELHQAQASAREEASVRAKLEERLQILELDKNDVTQRHEEASSRLKDHVSSLTALQAAVSSSTEKANLMERQLDEERAQREALEIKLAQLKTEHEERTTELEIATKRLRDAEELAESHAKEAATHKEAFLNGLAKAAAYNPSGNDRNLVDQKIAILQQSADKAHALVRSNQDAADLAVQKLRNAEERIAGLEAYQEQTSREALQLRRQLQAAMKEIQAQQQQTRDARSQLENHQRDASALAVQHGALKELLGERGVNISDVRKSPLLDMGPSSRLSTPEQNKLRELEQQLQNSLKAHEESKASFENREAEADRAYREKLEQLENDFQSAVHYVKGTEKMLKRMKDELGKYKSQNSKLQNELDEARKASDTIPREDGSKSAEWESERSALQNSIEDLKSQSGSQIAALEAQISTIRSELESTRAERDQHRSTQEELDRQTQQIGSELAALKAENNMLETRAIDAEQKVTILLDQVGQSVGNYRRQSQMIGNSQSTPVNGTGHKHQASTSTTASSKRDGTESTATPDESTYIDNRGSLALDSLASELDALRTHWESTNRNYRLSNQFDFERTPTKENGGGELSDTMTNWRKRIEEEGGHVPEDSEPSAAAAAANVTPTAAVAQGGMI